MANPLLSVKLPYVDEYNSVDDVVNHMVKTLNSTKNKAAISSVDNSSAMPIGTVLTSMLTLAQIQSVYGPGWVLMNGASCAGSEFASITGITTLPDARGRALRGKDHGAGNNPDGDTALGTYQADLARVTGGTAFSGATHPAFSATDQGSSIGVETRMKNITVNIFIKIN